MDLSPGRRRVPLMRRAGEIRSCMRNLHCNSPECQRGNLNVPFADARGLGHGRNRVALQRALRAERLKTVTDPEYRFDVLLAISPELLPQTADMHVERASSYLRAIAPDSPEQGFAGNDFARILHQKRQQFEFLASQDQPP